MIDKSSIKRGDIFYVDFEPVVGSEQGGMRPAIVIQNDVGNKFSPTVIVAAMTSNPGKAKMPTHVRLDSKELRSDSVVLLEQIRTVDKRRLLQCIGHVGKREMKWINRALLISLGLDELLY